VQHLIGGAEAEKALAKLAKEAPDPLVKREAKTARESLARRTKDKS
jgi:hypothetical protein